MSTYEEKRIMTLKKALKRAISALNQMPNTNKLLPVLKRAYLNKE